MDIFAKNLRRRAKELNLSNAEVARRAGLGERRYGNYVSGTREPDLATLIRIAETLGTTPNTLLGIGEVESGTRKDLLKDRLSAAADAMNEGQLETAVIQAEAVIVARERGT